MNKAKVEEMETRLAKSIHDYIDVRKLYEDQLRSSHVYKEKIAELEAKIQELENEVASLRDQLAQVEQRIILAQREEEHERLKPVKDTAEASV